MSESVDVEVHECIHMQREQLLFIHTPNLTTKSRAWKIGVCYSELIWEQELRVKSICASEGGR